MFPNYFSSYFPITSSPLISYCFLYLHVHNFIWFLLLPYFNPIIYPHIPFPYFFLTYRTSSFHLISKFPSPHVYYTLPPFSLLLFPWLPPLTSSCLISHPASLSITYIHFLFFLYSLFFPSPYLYYSPPSISSMFLYSVLFHFFITYSPLISY